MQIDLHNTPEKNTLPGVRQYAEVLLGNEIHVVELPAPQAEVIAGVKWGQFDHIFSPAFWFVRAWYQRAHAPVVHRLGENLVEEIVACLLGGYGLPAEIGLAAFARLKQNGMLANLVSEENIFRALMEPLIVRGRRVHYRYPRQRSHFVAEALKRVNSSPPPAVTDDLRFRGWLLGFKGIGLKTASWITRNFLDSDNVAILDVHIYRAGLLAGVFSPEQTVVRDYQVLEEQLVRFATALNVRLALLDSLMWSEMRQMGSFAIFALRNRGYLPAALG
jgi:N-glycosylase/DNA lyase